MAEEENLKVRYVPLPVKAVPPKEVWDDVRVMKPLPWQYYLCERSRSAFMVSTWTLALNTTGEPMEWVKEGVLHCEELWAALLAASYEDIPRVHVTCPIVSPENPDVVCFMADDIDSETNGNTKSWTLEVDMRRKKLISVVSCNRCAHPIQWDVCVNYGKPFSC
jgi:hypothetical protein